MNQNTTQAAATQPAKRRTTPKWAGTPGYSNPGYADSKPASKFNEMLFDGDSSAGDTELMFSAKR